MTEVKCKFCEEFEQAHDHPRAGTCLGCEELGAVNLEKLADLHAYESQFG